MSRTHHDQKRYVYKHHPEVCQRRIYSTWHRDGECECRRWYDYIHAAYWTVPSWWNRYIRRSDRAFRRNRMQRARAGSLPWSAVDEKRTDEWYW